MSEAKFVIGKQYRVADASKCGALTAVLDAGLLKLPDVFTVSYIDDDGDAYSVTEGVIWRGMSASVVTRSHGWMVAAHCSLEEGAFEEVLV